MRLYILSLLHINTLSRQCIYVIMVIIGNTINSDRLIVWYLGTKIQVRIYYVQNVAH